MRVFIVDDEQPAVDTLSKVLITFFRGIKIVGSSQSVEDAYEQIKEKQPDLVFLDVEMGKESGFQLLEKFERISFHVVFVTAYAEYALKAIKFSALDYLIKPVSLQDLKNLLQKVEMITIGKNDHQKIKHMFSNFLHDDKNSHKITIAVADGYEFIKVGDIFYLTADGSYTNFFLKSGQRITTSKNLKYFEGILEDYGFYRIHNSTLINLRYIKKLNRSAGGSVIMENLEEFSVSKSRKEDFLALLSLK